MRCAETVLAKPALPCARWLFGPHAAADQAVADLQQRLLAHTEALLRQATVSAPVRAAPPPTADAWTLTVAAALQARCPALLDLAMDGRFEPPDARLLWQWWQWLQRGPARPRVLEIGAGAMAAPLHAVVHALGGHIITACTERARALALYARLQAVGIDADVLHVPLVDAGFEQVEGRFANVEVIPDEAGPFDLVLVCADGLADTGSDARLALPMIASRLNPGGFRVCLWSPGDARPLAAATALWRSVAPDLEFSEGAFGGAALVVQAAMPAPVAV
jgi:SAM-dependent methyltransferase